MNRSLYTFLAGGMLLIVGASCKKESLLTYKSDNNIYFNFIEGTNPATNDLGRHQDTLDITFSFNDASVTDTIINIPVAVTGEASAENRNFNLMVDPASTAKAGTNYELPSSFVVRAGLTQDTVRIRFKRTPELKTTVLSLLLNLADNDQFKANLLYRNRSPQSQTTPIYSTDTVRMKTFKITVGDMLAAGPYWPSYYEYSFGTFSEKKVRLMNQIVGMPLSFWSKPTTTAQERSDVAYYGSFVARYLSDQAYAGNTIFEADGITPMKMGNRFP
ncbi:MAG: DUF4843 domain-containing protein [Pseudobacter sp.]|uniref:DUF4843 domain-containing protein n=1 Tax=Pseudobacter sp. TaxID=2045420 RepID=UPI003F7EC4E4